ncbi:MAG: ATP-binding cassette domain-containing protein, partial [Pseudomonadota bacterium]
MLQVEGVTVRYGKVAAVREATLRVEAGELVTLIGANGAGKSTLLKAISGLLPLAAGAIRFEGRSIGNT